MLTLALLTVCCVSSPEHPKSLLHRAAVARCDRAMLCAGGAGGQWRGGHGVPQAELQAAHVPRGTRTQSVDSGRTFRTWSVWHRSFISNTLSVAVSAYTPQRCGRICAQAWKLGNADLSLLCKGTRVVSDGPPMQKNWSPKEG